MRDFKKIQVWQKSHSFVLKIYKATENFSREELFGLTSQLRRAAASIPTNIAEGAGRETQKNLLALFMLQLVQPVKLNINYY
jgi:four helix bundle protein